MTLRELYKKWASRFAKRRWDSLVVHFGKPDDYQNGCDAYITDVIAPELDEPQNSSRLFNTDFILVCKREQSSEDAAFNPPKDVLSAPMFDNWMRRDGLKQWGNCYVKVQKSFRSKYGYHKMGSSKGKEIPNGRYDVKEVYLDSQTKQLILFAY